MARPINLLTAVQVRTLGPGRHADGKGLYLLIKEAGGASWVVRYKQAGKQRDAGLGAARGGEVIGATWGEIDIKEKAWTIPAVRMKAKREHRVPLAPAALAILADVAKLRGSDDPALPVFPGQGGLRGLSNMAMLTVLRRMKRDDVTPHGMRSAFRDWASERTTYGPEVAEMALAHAVGDKVEAAYRRGDLFTKRRGLMDDWATFASAPANAAPGKVISLRTRDTADTSDTTPSSRAVRR